MHKVIISGGPSTGKSTAFEALREIYPNALFMEEAAERVIQAELEKQSKDPEYVPIMPVTSYRAFAPLVISQQVKQEESIPPDTELAFMDRCIIDNLGYLAYNGISEHTSMIRRHARRAGYTIAFFCEWLDKFERTTIRRETPEQGLAIHQHLQAAYESVDIPLVYLPAVSVEERLTIIKQTLDTI